MLEEENYQQKTKKNNYRINFINNVEEITLKTYSEGIKLLEPLYFEEPLISEDDKHKCLCGHIIHKILYFSYNNKIYKIGSECINKLKDDFDDEQKEKIEIIFNNYKKIKKDIKNDYKIIKKEYAKIQKKENEFYYSIMNKFNEQKKYIIEKENEFLNKPRIMKNNTYTFNYLISNMNNEKCKGILLFYLNTYSYFTDSQRKYLKHCLTIKMNKNKL
jgi:hypothetical protein